MGLGWIGGSSNTAIQWHIVQDRFLLLTFRLWVSASSSSNSCSWKSPWYFHIENSWLLSVVNRSFLTVNHDAGLLWISIAPGCGHSRRPWYGRQSLPRPCSRRVLTTPWWGWCWVGWGCLREKRIFHFSALWPSCKTCWACSWICWLPCPPRSCECPCSPADRDQDYIERVSFFSHFVCHSNFIGMEVTWSWQHHHADNLIYILAANIIFSMMEILGSSTSPAHEGRLLPVLASPPLLLLWETDLSLSQSGGALISCAVTYLIKLIYTGVSQLQKVTEKRQNHSEFPSSKVILRLSKICV